MTIIIPVWLLWTLGIIGGVIALIVLGIIIGLCMLGIGVVKALSRGINW